MMQFSRHTSLSLAAALALLLTTSPVLAQSEDQAAQAEYEQALQEAEQSRREAEESLQRANQEMERAQREAVTDRVQQQGYEEARQEEMMRMREELGRRHRELRETQREITRVHREIAIGEGQPDRFRYEFVVDRPVIGVVLGPQSADGVEILGISPDGPSERAGLQQGDVIVAMNNEFLSSGGNQEPPRAVIHRLMGEARPGEPMDIEVQRGDERLIFTVTPEQRQPLVWESVAPLPSDPDGLQSIEIAPSIHVETIVIPDLDEVELAEQIEGLEERVARLKFVAPPDITVDFVDPENVQAYAFSSIGNEAFQEANMWFGLPMSTGVKLAPLNEGLGDYFGIDHGVLVLDTREDNALDLEPGDVIVSINGNSVDQPGDVFRVLRRHVPGDVLTIEIQRQNQSETIETVMPEPRWERKIGHRRAPHPDTDAGH